ncbi:hypothetical protein WG904_02825 [Pedobacter sp. Du54]|uniref:hypothetical protein n=1 Tax=Pedobacter anseongensis TaxID=3133439 RepID=UPI0030A3621F
MKTFKNITAAFALIITLFAGCKNPAEDVQIVVNTDIFKSPTLIQFVNGNPLLDGPKVFTVQITGPGASLVRTPTGSREFKTAEGSLNLVLDRSANPTPANPVKFTIIANATGFAPTYQDIEITSETDPKIYQVRMTEYANPMAGSTSVVATSPISNGTTSADIKFSTIPNAGMPQKSDITIPTGTGLLDATGQSVGGAQLEARIIHSAKAADGTFANLPGGGYASNVIGTNGQPVPGGVYFDPVGVVSINMFANNKEIKSFTKPVIIDMEVNNDIINPTTNQPIKENETVAMYSLNTATGQWKAEGDATFVKNTAGVLVARMPITHLSDWAYIFPASAGCPTTITINRPNADEDELFYFKDVLDWGKGTLIMKKGEKTKSFTGSTIRSANRLTVKAESDKYVNRELVSGTNSYCNKTTTFTFVEKPDLVGVDLDIKFKCSTKDLLTGINAFITITPVGGNASQASSGSLVKGIGSGTIVNGTTYKIVASVDGVAYTSQFTANKNNFELPSGFDLTGTVVYNSATNRLTINGQVTKNCN